MPLLEFEYTIPEPDDDPVQFTVTARTADGEVARKETFTTRDVMPLSAFAEMGLTMTGSWIASRVGLARFFTKAIIPSDVPRWQEMVDDPTLLIDTTYLVGIMEKLVEGLVNRPTGAPSD